MSKSPTYLKPNSQLTLSNNEKIGMENMDGSVQVAITVMITKTFIFVLTDIGTLSNEPRVLFNLHNNFSHFTDMETEAQRC